MKAEPPRGPALKPADERVHGVRDERKKKPLPRKLRGPALTREIGRMIGEGARWIDVQHALDIHERTVAYHVKKLRTQGAEGPLWSTVAGQPDPIPLESIKDPAVLACLDDTPEGFRAFFNRYSGYAEHPKWPGMQPHCFAFVEAAYERPTSTGRADGTGELQHDAEVVEADTAQALPGNRRREAST